MNVKRAGVGLAAVEGQLIAVGGFDDSSPLDSVESYDPRTGKWSLISSLINPRGGVGVASLGGWVFAVGGHDGRSYLSSVEVYNIYKQSWEPLACMMTSRAGAGVAGLPMHSQ
jgi:kelch-like protein 8